MRDSGMLKYLILNIRLLALIVVILYAISVLLAAKEAHGQETYEMEPYYEVPQPCNALIDKIEAYEDWDTSMVIRLAMKESGCRPKNHNLTDSHRTCKGSFNILSVGCIHYKKGEDINSVDLNIKKAHDLYVKAGYSFRDWTTCKKVKGCR